MKILMISLDKNLLGIEGAFGDATERHKLYGKHVENLDIIVMNKGKESELEISHNVRAYPTSSWSRFCYFLDAYKIGKKIFQKRKFDLIVCQDPFLTGLAGYLLKRKTKTKLVVHSHGDFFGNKYWLKENWFNLPLLCIGKFVIKKADAIRVVSGVIKEKLVKMNILENKIYKISTPVQLEKFSQFNNERVEEIKNKYNNRKIILLVGRLVKAKNIFLLIDAFKKVLNGYNDTVLLVAGSGELKEDLEKQIEKHNLQEKVFLLGAVNHDDLPNFYKACEFFVLPSTNESFGKVLLEAAAAKKPSIASSTIGAQEIIQEGKTGFIVPINDKDKLTGKILFLLKNKEKTTEMGEEARSYILKEFSLEKSIEKIIKMWNAVYKAKSL
ncbi:glycosyltransferase family 4 protein [Candidatus Falkowbacteria bacterium]|jgi:glycosyltransferase involved in cell wall biosynthesis|nr:glycosyltransferase family 4 protein [Candidatus Falkowbacteria bacterium]MBT4433366.1 glycosyltransferase family 4 protein [Candidatus Falkowbacteria bacterium]